MKEVGIEFEDMPIERWQVLIIMPLGFLLTGWRFMQILIGLVTGKTDRLHLADEAAEAMKLSARNRFCQRNLWRWIYPLCSRSG